MIMVFPKPQVALITTHANSDAKIKTKYTVPSLHITATREPRRTCSPRLAHTFQIVRANMTT